MLKKLLLSAFLALAPAVAVAAGHYAPISAGGLGFSSAQNLTGGVSSSSIDMGFGRTTGHNTKLILLMTVVWGTSTTFDVTGEYSYDGTNWFSITRCTSATTHICDERVWQFAATYGTTVSLDYIAASPYVRFTFTAPSGTGTIVVSAIRSP